MGETAGEAFMGELLLERHSWEQLLERHSWELFLHFGPVTTRKDPEVVVTFLQLCSIWLASHWARRISSSCRPHGYLHSHECF